MGLFAVVAPPVARRIGPDRVVTLALILIAVGTAARAFGAAVGLYAGAVVAGVGIAIGGVLLPALVKARFPDRVGPVTGLYTCGLIGGALVAAAGTEPLRRALGLSVGGGPGAVGAARRRRAPGLAAGGSRVDGRARARTGVTSRSRRRGERVTMAESHGLARHRLHGWAVAALLRRVGLARRSLHQPRYAGDPGRPPAGGVQRHAACVRARPAGAGPSRWRHPALDRGVSGGVDRRAGPGRAGADGGAVGVGGLAGPGHGRALRARADGSGRHLADAGGGGRGVRHGVLRGLPRGGGRAGRGRGAARRSPVATSRRSSP